MPFDGSGNYALSDTIAPATNADANELQAILDDIATALDKCVVADGQSTITGTLKGADGTALLPAYTFASDLNSGFYRIGSDNIGLSLGGTKRWDFGTAGTVITGTFGVSSDFTASGISTFTGVATFNADPIFLSTDAGAGAGPTLDIFRDSATPAISDFLGAVNINGRSSTAVKRTYARWLTQVTDPTNASEDANIIFQSIIAGTLATVLQSSGADIAIPGALTVTGALTGSAAVSGATAAGAMVATQAEQETGSATDKLVTPGRQQFHPSAAKWWMKSVVTGGTPAAPSASYNVTSITDTNIGRLTITIATDFSSAEWVCVAMSQSTNAAAKWIIVNGASAAAGSIELGSVLATSTASDPDAWEAAGYGDQ